MRPILAAAFAAAVLPPTSLSADDNRTAADPLAVHRWEARPILIFAHDAADPRLTAQLARFAAASEDLAERDNIVIVDTTPGSTLRKRFAPDDFTVVLVGLDGGEKFRASDVVEAEVLAELIDAMPMRRRELESGL